MTINVGRFTADYDDSIVIFIIGMRINHFHKIGKWLPVARAMGPMLKELAEDKESGFLGSEPMLHSLRTFAFIQYWRDFDSLETYARDRSRNHWPAWAAFNKAVGNNGSVGVFHETYVVQKHASETVYANVPSFGLGKVAGLAPATGSRAVARSRMNAGIDQS